MLCEAHGVEVSPWDGDLGEISGLRVVIARTNRADNLTLHDDLVAAVVDAIG